MSDKIKRDAIITKRCPNCTFKVKVENFEEEIDGYLAGKLRQKDVWVEEGDKVIIELSPYDLTRGRIIYRKKE